MKKNKALFAISSLWLWHATRTMVIISHFLKKWYEIDLISFWNALKFLKLELKNQKINFIEFTDYPALERWTWWKFYFYLFLDVFKTTILIKKENKFVENIAKNYDFIFSDWKYWVYSKEVPSFLLNHQLAFVMPKWMWFLQWFTDWLNIKYIRNFDYLFIPDYENFENSLAWRLSHPNWINKVNHSYIWILSSFLDYEKKQNNKIDYLFTISWYLHEHKESFVDKLLEQAKKLNWKKVFILWNTKNNYKKELENDINIYSFLGWEDRKEMFFNAETIISRAWYTTIMDLVELWKKAILFPTPNQTEQEYLAIYLKEKNMFVFWEEKDDFKKLIKKTTELSPLDNLKKTEKSLEIIDKIIFNYIF